MEIEPIPERKREKVRRLSPRREVFVFLREARAWAVENAHRLARMHIKLTRRAYFMYIIPKTMPYDSELTRSHAAFTIRLWDKYHITSHGQQIPDMPVDELSAFFNPTNTFTITPV